jgi:phosphoribosyl 1,2-cyclic phosphodiesterase
MEKGINVYCSGGTATKLPKHHRLVEVKSKQVFQVGNFKIMPFDVIHDAKEPFGYIIDHPETGKIVFLTDTHYSKYVFKHINHYMIEANYVEDIVDNLVNCGKLQGFRYDRIYRSHMSLETCKKLLQANDLSQTNNIVLIHLSDSHSDEGRMKKEIIELTGKMVHVARTGLEIELKKEIV